MKIIAYALLLCILPLAQAATISGTTYDHTLHAIPTTLIINSTPAQTYVAGEGTYSLDVSTGTYRVLVHSINSAGLELKEEQIIEINNEQSTATLDFIIFPSISEVDEPDIDLNLDDEEDKTHWLNTPLLIMAILLLLLLIILMRSHHSRPEEKKDDDMLEQRILAIIKAHRRITQKDLRKRIPESESAVSLVITSLEKTRRIEKIKKGRGNIIVFKK